MPCQKCSNGKWKYGEHGNCQFDTLAACKRAEAAIHAQENKTAYPDAEQPMPADWHDPGCGCTVCKTL